MVIKIKNWSRFQHFKDRKPPWIKLYRDLLDDLEWYELDAESSKILVMLWLIASESGDGSLPNEKNLSFRLRITESKLKQHITKLSHWLYHDDINVISGLYQVVTPETETETETECYITSLKKDDFEEFWKKYPKKVGREPALKAWGKIHFNNGILEEVMNGLSQAMLSEQWTRDNGKFIPNPATWLNQKRWTDQHSLLMDDPWEGAI